MRVEVIVLEGDRAVGRHIIQRGEYLIGRDPACPIQIDDPKTEPLHARLSFDGETVSVEDLGSTSGTFIDGLLLPGRVELQPLQRLQIGDVTFVFHSQPERGDLAHGGNGDHLPSAVCDTCPILLPVPKGQLRPRNYSIGCELARGGMGAVLCATDLNIERTVAMKIGIDGKLTPEDLRRRFLQEAKITGQLEHPGIVPIYELGLNELGQPFYTMKFVHGVTLGEIISKLIQSDPDTLAQYSLRRLLTIFQKACDAVAFAHSRGVLHRDLKPDNIMIGEYGEVLVMDWGVAHILGNADCGLRRAKGESTDRLDPIQPAADADELEEVVGTPHYIAPEQLAGKRSALDARADIYALGGILYYILTFFPPNDGATLEELVKLCSVGKIIPPVEFNRARRRRRKHALVEGLARELQGHYSFQTIPSSLAAVALKALAFIPAERYPTVVEMQRDIEAFQAGFATAAENAGPAKRLALLVKRHQREFSVLGVATLLLLIVMAVSLVKVSVARDHAQNALWELQRTAPELYDQALYLVGDRAYDPALSRISQAIRLAPERADYYVLRGNICEVLLRLNEARGAYAEAVRLDPHHASARQNLRLCDQLMAGTQGHLKWTPRLLAELIAALRGQGRTADALAILERFRADRRLYLTTWMLLLEQAGAGEKSLTLKMDNEGFYSLDLSGSGLRDLSVLQGLPLSVLRLSGTPVKDLGPLRDMPLRQIILDHTAVTDLSPLVECPQLAVVVLPPQPFNPALLRRLPALQRLGYTWTGNETDLPTADDFWKTEVTVKPAPR